MRTLICQLCVLACALVLFGCSPGVLTSSDVNSVAGRTSGIDKMVDPTPLVIEVFTGGFDQYLDARAAGISEADYDAWRMRVYSKISQDPYSVVQLEKKDAEPKAAIAAAEQKNFQAEMVHFIRQQFPNATVLTMTNSILEQGKRKSFFEKYHYYPTSDIRVGVFVLPGLKPSDADTGSSFGNSFSVTVFMTTTTAPMEFFNTLYGGRQPRTMVDQAQQLFDIPCSRAEIEATRQQLADDPTSLLGFDREWARLRYNDFDLVHLRNEDNAIDIIVRGWRAYQAMAGRVPKLEVFTASGDAMQRYSGDPETSPIKPLHQWASSELKNYLSAINVDQLRLKTFRQWAGFYEPDAGKLASMNARWLDDPKSAPAMIRPLLSIRKAEIELGLRLTKLTVTDPAAGQAGELVRNMLREQTQLRSSYQSEQAIATMTQFLGFGLAVGSASIKDNTARNLTYQAGVGSLDFSRQSLQLAVMFDQRGEEASEAIAKAIGPIQIEIDGEEQTFIVKDLDDLRTQAKKKYQAFVQKHSSPAAMPS